ncbi:MAG TPA: hypothetical protein VFW65_02870 [Pseudonocardiaceae bacterium]|nr:hypothetical protein [Pseudonocardiaceae bacterium]
MSEPELVGPPDDRPVFVDASGRRRRTVGRVAVMFVAAIAAAAGILVAALLGAPVVPTALLPAPHVSESPTPSSRQAPRPPTRGTTAVAPPIVRTPATISGQVAGGAVTTTAPTVPAAPSTTATHPGNATHGTGNKPTARPSVPGHRH